MDIKTDGPFLGSATEISNSIGVLQESWDLSDWQVQASDVASTAPSRCLWIRVGWTQRRSQLSQRMDGFSDFRFGIHRKDLVAGPEHWAPSETGAYVYLSSCPLGLLPNLQIWSFISILSHLSMLSFWRSSIYFPVEQAAEANSLLSKMTQLLQQEGCIGVMVSLKRCSWGNF